MKAQVSARATSGFALRFIASTSPAFSDRIKSSAVLVQSHGIARGEIGGLAPNTTYYVGVENLLGVRDENWTGRLRTPGSGAHGFSFGFASCSADPSSHAYAEIASRLESGSMAFFLHLGDLHYADITSNNETLYHNQYNGRMVGDAGDMFRSGSVYYTWDDHDYGANDSGRDSPSRQAAVAAFRRRVPVRTALHGAEDAVYYSFVRGRVRFIVSDLRSERVEKLVHHAESPHQRMMTEAQKVWFFGELLAAQAAGQAVIWASSMPWVASTFDGSVANIADTWGGYAGQRLDIAEFINGLGLNNRIAIVSGDMHRCAFDDGSSPFNMARLITAQSAPLKEGATTKGGPYLILPLAEQPAGVWLHQFSMLDVTDSGGSTLSLRLRAFRYNHDTAAETILIDQTFALAASAPSLAAATLTAPSASPVDLHGGAITVTTNRADGVIFAVVTGSSTAPAADQIKAGRDHADNAALLVGHAAVRSAGAVTVLFPYGLEKQTQHWIHAIHLRGSTTSNVVSGSFTTASEATSPPDTVLIYNTTTGGSLTVRIPLWGEIDARIDWGDGSHNDYVTPGNKQRTYASHGTYTVTISGKVSWIGGDGVTHPGLIEVVRYGAGHGLTSVSRLHDASENLTAVPASIPRSIVGLDRVFRTSAVNFSNVIGWDVSRVVNFREMFRNAWLFNQDIGGWDTGRAETMAQMFRSAVLFNQNIGGWNVSQCRDFSLMFRTAEAFNQPLNNWDVSRAHTMAEMFLRAESFNQPLNNWDVSRVTDMSLMFEDAALFNQPLNNWNVSRVTNMSSMFRRSGFNQNIGGWNITNVTNMTNMFNGAGLSTPNYDALLIGWASQNVRPNVTFHAGNSKYTAGGAAAAARSTLISTHGWTITDGGTA